MRFLWSHYSRTTPNWLSRTECKNPPLPSTSRWTAPPNSSPPCNSATSLWFPLLSHTAPTCTTPHTPLTVLALSVKILSDYHFFLSYSTFVIERLSAASLGSSCLWNSGFWFTYVATCAGACSGRSILRLAVRVNYWRCWLSAAWRLTHPSLWCPLSTRSSLYTSTLYSFCLFSIRSVNEPYPPSCFPPLH